MSVTDGMKANAQNLNAAFVSKKVDSEMKGVLTLGNTASAESGLVVPNAQQAINEAFKTIGMTSATDPLKNNYSSTEFVAPGDDRKVAIGKLDSAIAQTNNNLTTTNTALISAVSEIAAINSILPTKVDGPETAVQNSVPVFDQDSGTIVKETGVLIDSSNNVTGINNLAIAGNLTVQGTTTTLNSQTLDVADKNITLSKGGNDVAAEGAGLSIERTSTSGSFIFDSTLPSKFKLGLVGSEAEVVDVSSSQTLTNKTVSSPSLSGQVKLAAQALLKFFDTLGTRSVTFKAPANIPNDVTYTLPSVDGSTGQTLTTDGAGNLSWSTVASPSVSSSYSFVAYHSNAQTLSGYSDQLLIPNNVIVNTGADGTWSSGSFTFNRSGEYEVGFLSSMTCTGVVAGNVCRIRITLGGSYYGHDFAYHESSLASAKNLKAVVPIIVPAAGYVLQWTAYHNYANQQLTSTGIGDSRFWIKRVK